MRWTRLTLVITEAFVALSAFVAGAMFVAEPSGRLMGMTEATLARSPFGSYLVPGIVLFMVVGGTQALAAWAEIRRWPLGIHIHLRDGGHLGLGHGASSLSRPLL